MNKHLAARSSHWQIQRERHQIADSYPTAPNSESTSIEPVVAALMKKLGLGAEQWIVQLQSDWTHLVGATLATHTRPASFENGNLQIFVDSSPWLSELSRFAKPELLRKLKQRYGPNKIRNVRFSIDPDGPRPNPHAH